MSCSATFRLYPSGDGDAQRPGLHFKRLTGDRLESGMERATLYRERWRKQPSQSFRERRQTRPSVVNAGGLEDACRGPSGRTTD